MFKYEGNGKMNKRQEKIAEVQDVVGFKTRNPFGTKSEAVLEEKLSTSSLIDLQRMAVSAGVSATGTMPSLKKKIRTAFKKYIAESGGYKIRDIESSFTEEQQEKVKKLSNV